MSSTPIIADLLSDTLTRPSEGMRAAMAAAPVGDDVFGEDPTVRELEQRAAALLGHEDGLYTPSGSMANQLGIWLHTEPGQEFIADSLGHVVRAELGAAAAFSGVTSRTWVAPRGLLRASDPLELMITDGGTYQVRTALIVIENTHNFGGGTVQPLGEIEAVRAVSQDQGVAMHLDGARLGNAHVASGVALADYGRQFDTVSLCLSKGLGAPVGSVLVGSAEDMARARIQRKRLGGGMRQVGILAAAGLYALEHNVARLADDHARARHVAQAAHDAAPGVIDPATVETNIVVLNVSAAGWSAPDFMAATAARGIRTYAMSGTLIRMVWHLDVTQEGTDAAAEVVADLLRTAPTA